MAARKSTKSTTTETESSAENGVTAPRTPARASTRRAKPKAEEAEAPALVSEPVDQPAAAEPVAEATPVESTPVESSPVESTPVEDAPVEDAPGAADSAEPAAEAPPVESPAEPVAAGDAQAEPVVMAAAAAEPVAPVPVPEEPEEPAPAIVQAPPAPVTIIMETTSQPAEQAAAVSIAAVMTAPVSVEQVFALTQQKVDKMSKQAFQAYEDFAGFQKDNVDAIVSASNIMAKGFESVSKEMMAFTQAQMEQGVAITKAMLGVKTMRELVDMQSEYTRTTFDTMIAEATKLSEMSVKVANEAMEPISARINATIEKIAKPVAA